MAQFHDDKMAEYVTGLAKKTESFEHVATEHLRMSGIYWGLTAMALMGRQEAMKTDEIVSFVLRCMHPCGGFSGNIGHDPHSNKS